MFPDDREKAINAAGQEISSHIQRMAQEIADRVNINRDIGDILNNDDE